MGRDKVIIGEFLRGLNEHLGASFRITDLPDELERQKQAVDVIAQDERGQTLAVEHTLIQPFVGEKDDSVRFRAAIGPLEADTSLRIPGKSVDLCVPVGAIPKRRECGEVPAKVVDWFRRVRPSLPVGRSDHNVPGLGFDLTVHVDMDESAHPEGGIYVARSGMPQGFDCVVGRALEDKLPKLAAARADKRILLFEKDNLPHGYVEICKILDSLGGGLPDLLKIDEVWVVNTVSWASGGGLFFYRVWPGGITDKFRVGSD
jgi:hypothetical protein